MPDVPLNFDWEVAQAGYRWLETHAMGQSPKVRWHYLTPVPNRGNAPYMARRYHPLSAYSGLFRNFAATELSLDGVKAFADRFGLLGGDLGKRIVLLDQGREGSRPGGVGEHARDWLEEIIAMQRAVGLWEAARQGDAEHLGRMIFWSEDNSQVVFDTHPEPEVGQLPPEPTQRAVIADERLDPEILARFVPGDRVGPALHFMQRLINDHLHRRASPRLLWEQNRDRLGLYLVPDGLIGVLWLQFARAVDRDAQFRQCLECETWFEVAPGRGRTDKQFCSTACRTRAYRKRQIEAARLHDEGRSLEEIARALDSDPETVKGWIERMGGSSAPPPVDDG